MHSSIEQDENDELDDLEAFRYNLLVTCDLRVCASCGEERGGHLIPDRIYATTDPLFEPFSGDLVLIPGEPVRVCDKCRLVLRTGKRPIWATRFPLRDVRFLDLSPLELRLIRPIIPVVTIYSLPGEGQYATTGGTVSFINDAIKVANRLPLSGLYLNPSTTRAPFPFLNRKKGRRACIYY